jgi:uncharacterized caspase-like protein
LDLRLSVLIFSFVYLLCALPSPASADKRVALVIGNAEYPNGVLANPTFDADLVSAGLRQVGFDVTEVINADHGALDASLRDFERKKDGADIAVFYFAGQGVAVVGDGQRPRNYLMPISAHMLAASNAALRSEGIPFDDLTEGMPATLTLIVVDACRKASGTRGVAEDRRSFEFVDHIPGLFFGLSTQPCKMRQDGQKVNGSPLAQSFATAIATPGLIINDVLVKVRDEVAQKTGGAQKLEITTDGQPQNAFPPINVPAQAPVASTPPTPVVVASPPPAPAPPIPARRADSERRVALVIGNSAYRAVEILPNPSKDAELIGAALRHSGIEDVTVLHDLDRQGMIAALNAFAKKADVADWAVIYYAGHGIEFGGTNYLIPVDARLETDLSLADEAITLERMQSAIGRAHKLKLIVLDACRTNPFAKQMKMTSADRSISRGFAPFEPTGATLVVYAAKAGTSAKDGDGVDSPFAMSFAKRIVEPGLEITMTFRFVRQDVLQTTGNQQEPFVYGSLPPDYFYFVPPK